jgi:SAM-dependent methyltransferase
MTKDGPSYAPSSRTDRLSVREWLGVALGRDAVQVPGSADGGPGPAAGTLLPPQLQLFVLSFLMLFVELALIRWSGALVIYLSYFSNFVLLGSFLGIGIGFLRARARVNLFPWAPVALALLILYVRVFPVQVIRNGNAGIIFFGYGKFHASGPPTWVTLPVVFLAVAAVMAMIGEGVARTFIRFRPLDAYRLDIAGSITGIAAFSLLSFLNAKPAVWALIVALVMLLVYGRRAGLIQIAAVLAIVLLLWSESLSSSDIWSPYYRISVQPSGPGRYSINVNGIPHQNIIPVRQLQKVYSQPYLDAPANPLNDVLIVGAGTGDDVANALLHGARHIDAVEIDPQLYQLGKRLNPDHPYSDPRVTAHINDGRAFLEQTHHKYDMILFALPDSLTLVAGQSSLRLESYLFTVEAVQAAKDHLKPDGLFAMYNYYRTPWLRDRLANTEQVAFGHTPCVDDEGFSLSMISDTVNPSALRCTTSWHRPADVVAPATDNHPFVYLDGNTIPWIYRITLGLILLASLLLVRPAAGPYRRMRGYVDLFFMGAAFLLLETKSIVQFALLFGTTWFVNALVTAGVLVSVLAAVEVSRHVVVRRPALLYLALLAALIVAWAIPPSSLLSLSPLPRFVVAVIVAFTPIFLANMVFAQRFSDVDDSTTAFGANLLGAMLGGVLEYASLIVGYRWLLVFVAILYGLAFLTGRRHLRVTDPAAKRTPQPVSRA